MQSNRVLFTIGHSTQELAQLIGTLRWHGITTLVDVRSYPGSRRHPQFNLGSLEHTIPDAGIRYVHIPDLGGRRHTHAADPALNAAWTNTSFRSYADWTLTDVFTRGLETLFEEADRTRRLAFMCSEATPWRCHRSIISTILTAHGHQVHHIMGRTLHKHRLGEWGPAPYLDGDRVIFPKDAMAPLPDSLPQLV